MTSNITLTILRDGLTPVVIAGCESIEQAASAANEWRWAIGWKIEVDGMTVAESIIRRAK